MSRRAKFRKDRSNRSGDMAIFRFFKMAAVRHIGFVVGKLGRVLGGFYHCAQFGWNRCSSFDKVDILMFCVFGFKAPIHSRKWGFLGVFTP